MLKSEVLIGRFGYKFSAIVVIRGIFRNVHVIDITEHYLVLREYEVEKLISIDAIEEIWKVPEKKE